MLCLSDAESSWHPSAQSVTVVKGLLACIGVYVARTSELVKTAVLGEEGKCGPSCSPACAAHVIVDARLRRRCACVMHVVFATTARLLHQQLLHLHITYVCGQTPC